MLRPPPAKMGQISGNLASLVANKGFGWARLELFGSQRIQGLGFRMD